MAVTWLGTRAVTGPVTGGNAPVLWAAATLVAAGFGAVAPQRPTPADQSLVLWSRDTTVNQTPWLASAHRRSAGPPGVNEFVPGAIGKVEITLKPLEPGPDPAAEPQLAAMGREPLLKDGP